MIEKATASEQLRTQLISGLPKEIGKDSIFLWHTSPNEGNEAGFSFQWEGKVYDIVVHDRSIKTCKHCLHWDDDGWCCVQQGYPRNSASTCLRFERNPE